jgi:hypothetical protein
LVVGIRERLHNRFQRDPSEAITANRSPSSPVKASHGCDSVKGAGLKSGRMPRGERQRRLVETRGQSNWPAADGLGGPNLNLV